MKVLTEDAKAVRISIDSQTPPQTRVDSYIADRIGLFTRSQVKRRILSLRLNGKDVKPSRHVHPGDVLEITYREAPRSKVEAEAIELRIIYEDDNVLVIDKPGGMVVHPASGNWSGTLVNAILGHCAGLQQAFAADEARPGIVHRLDKQTTGVIVTAKNPQTREFLARQFRQRRAFKRYLAVVQGRLPEVRGRIDTRLGRDPHHRQRFTCLVGGSAGKRAVTDYRQLKVLDGYSFVSLHPRTGRTHQLRVHLAHLGCPIVGDRLYGWRGKASGEQPLMLHAYELRLQLPGQDEPRTFRAPLPAHFRRLLAPPRSSLRDKG